MGARWHRMENQARMSHARAGRIGVFGTKKRTMELLAAVGKGTSDAIASSSLDHPPFLPSPVLINR